MPPPQLASPLALRLSPSPFFPSEPLKRASGEVKLVLEPARVWVAQVCCAGEQVSVFPGWYALWGASWWTVACYLTV